MNEPKKSKNITLRVRLPKEWKKFDITKDPAINIIKNHTVSNKIEQLEKYIEVREQEIEELKEEIERLNKECDTYMEIATRKAKIIDKATEYIKERFDYVLKDESFLDHDDLVERRIALHLLNILKGDNK